MTASDASASIDWNSAPIQAKLDPEQMLSRLLELIRTSRYLSEFTPEKVSRVMGVEVKRAPDGSGGYSYYERVSPVWLQGFNFSSKHAEFTFSFDALPPGTSPSMADMCRLDLNKFSVELEAMGFSKTPHYDSPPFTLKDEDRLSHGRLMDYTFVRMKDGGGEMTVIVYPQGESEENVQHDCIERVLIH